MDKPTSNNLQKVYQYHRADINGIDEELSNFATFFLSSSTYNNTVENNWLLLKDKLLHIIEKYVPSKHVNNGNHLPWITCIKVQIKLRKSLYDKAKQMQAASD